MDDCTVLIYTHSEYADILDITLRRMLKHFSYAKLLVCTNNAQLVRERYPLLTSIHEYDDSLVYHLKLASALEMVTTEYVLLHHDNNCLYDDVKSEVMRLILGRMNEKRIDVVRLSACGIINPTISDPEIITRNNGPHYFSVFPSIWRTSSLYQVCTALRKAYRDSEDDESQVYMKKLCGYYISPTPQDPCADISSLYPSAHVIQYGRWCYTKHRRVIHDIVREYDIDLFIRGT
jgi:hypothetical protein